MFNDFSHYAYQLAFFTENSEIPADEFSVSCRKRLKIGVATPSFIPSFPGMPDDIPRLQIQSDSGYGVTLRGTRVDLVLDLAYGVGGNDKVVFLENATTMIGILAEHNFNFVRMGFVKRYLKVMDEPGKFISNLFGGRGGEGLVDFAVNGVVATDLLGRKCYDIYNYSAGVIRGAEPGVIAYRDLVILPGETALTVEEVEEFIGSADKLLSIDSLSIFAGGSHE